MKELVEVAVWVLKQKVEDDYEMYLESQRYLEDPSETNTFPELDSTIECLKVLDEQAGITFDPFSPVGHQWKDNS